MADKERAAIDDAPDMASSSIVKPLTRLSLNGLIAKKRKNTDDNNEPNNQPTRFAPPKKARRKNEKSLRETLGASTSHYRSSESYTRARPNTEINRTDLTALQYVSYLIEKCVTDPTETRFGDLRTHIHEMECASKFHNQELIDTSRILGDKGLKRIFEGRGSDVFPWDIKVDAESLWKRWTAGDLDASLLRGIEIEKKSKSTNYKIAEAYKDKRVSANAVGQNGLTNGQWWPMRVCAFRDGAHGEREAGIHGQTGKGAYSIVLAAGGYADKDSGDIIEYCGTASETPKPTSRTTFLRETLRSKNPIRVLRAMNKKSKYAPVEGIRYDGLYEITAEEVLDEKTGMYRFTLIRLPGQYPIRYQGVEARPTQQELAERTRIRNLIF